MRILHRVACFILMFALAGCSQLSRALPFLGTPTIDQSAIATSVAEQLAVRATQTAAAFPLLVQETLDSPTPQPLPEPTFIPPEQLANDCHYLPADMVDQPLPAPDSLHWQASGGQWNLLQGFYSPVLEAEPAPGGRWWAVRVLRRHIPAGTAGTALYVLDGIGDAHWQASADGSVDFRQYAWLSDGSLVWIDQQQLWISSGDGHDRRGLSLTEPVFEVFVGAENRLIVSGLTALWRQDGAGGWQRISDLDVLAGGGAIPAFSHSGANLAVSPDGEMAALVAGLPGKETRAQLWIVPFRADEPARQVIEFQYPGRGGRIAAPVWLAGSAYLSPGQRVTIPDTLVQNGFVLVATGTAERFTPARLLPADQQALNLQVSPDGQWLAVVAAPSAANPVEAQWSIHFFQAADLNPVTVASGDSVLAWRAFPPAALIAERRDSAQVVRQVVLPSGAEQTLAEVPEDTLPVIFELPAGLALFGSGRLQVFDLEGQAVSEHPFPLTFIQTTARQIGPTGSIFLAGVQAAKRADRCEFLFPVVLWYIQE